ncbi:MAG: CAP domain-containing protein [Pseudomonadota bacterium]
MLQFYDTLSGAAALALAAFAAPASAEPAACTPLDGYGAQSVSYADEALACLETASAARPDIEAGVRTLADRYRARGDSPPLAMRQSLNDAARLHALDMAARGYAAHEDLEGRGHLHRLRTLDRHLLFGAFGGNVAVVESANAIDAFNALISDEVNRDNLERNAFNLTGVGVAEAGGRLYVVQLFAQGDGELRQALPITLPSRAEIEAEFADAGFRPLGWRVEAADGRVLAHGRGDRLKDLDQLTEPGFLEVAVLRGETTYFLKGPMVDGR